MGRIYDRYLQLKQEGTTDPEEIIADLTVRFPDVMNMEVSPSEVRLAMGKVGATKEQIDAVMRGLEG